MHPPLCTHHPTIVHPSSAPVIPLATVHPLLSGRPPTVPAVPPSCHPLCTCHAPVMPPPCIVPCVSRSPLATCPRHPRAPSTSPTRPIHIARMSHVHVGPGPHLRPSPMHPASLLSHGALWHHAHHPLLPCHLWGMPGRVPN